MVVGRVYKRTVDNNLQRVVMYKGPSEVVMMNIVQDNSATQEFTIDFANDWAERVADFPSKWEEVEGLNLKTLVDAHMSPQYQG